MDPKHKELFEAFLAKFEAPKIKLEDQCFDKQLAFIQDTGLFATAMTSRRAGKTTACALHLLYTATRYTKAVCLYVTLARTNAKKIIWPMLLEMNQELGTGGVPNESDLALKFQNGSVIYCSGASTASEIDRFRGLALKIVYIDEAQSFGLYLKQLIDDVLVPACFDNRGLVRLIGTPPPVPVGFFIDALKNKNWSHHSWNMFNNPWIERKRGETAQQILVQELERRGVTTDDPTVQREFFGKIVIDTRRLVLEYVDKNHYEELPPSAGKSSFNHIFGIDLGYQDADAIAVLGYNKDSAATYLIDEVLATKQGLTELVNQIQTLRDKYQPIKMVIDTGGLGLKLAEEMRRRFKIPVHAAEKQRKLEALEILNDSLRTNRFRAKRHSRFANDANLLEWDFDRSTPDRRIISDRFHSDIIDAVLYAFRESPAFTFENAKPQPKVGSKEWAEEEVASMEKEAEERAKRGQATMMEGMEWI